MMADDQKIEISEADLHAFADGQLDADRRALVAEWLKSHPDDAADVAEWQAQNDGLLAAFSSDAGANSDDLALLAATAPVQPPSHRWRNLAAAVGLLFIGGVAGYGAHWAITPVPADAPLLASFTAEAADAYLTYVSEVRHAVEVGPDETDHLSSWLGKRLDWEFIIPDLSTEGFDLVGGRLLPINSQPGAMLLYEDATGQRVSVIIAHNNGMNDTAWQLDRRDDLGTYYWIDGPRSYAISARLADAELREVTSKVYAAFGEWPENYR